MKDISENRSRGRRIHEFFRLFPKRPPVIFLVVGLSLLSSFLLSAEQTILYKYISEQHDAELEDILYLSMGIELANAGFSSSRSLDTASYVLEIGYAPVGDEVNIHCVLFNSRSPKDPLGETSIQTKIDYGFDAAIATLVADLLSRSGLDSSPAQATEIQGLFTHSGTTGGMTLEEIAAAKAVRIDTGLGLGGMFFFGDMAELFHYGATAAFSAGVRIPQEKRSFESGMRVTVTRVFNDSGITGGPLYLSTAGPNFMYGNGYRSSFRFSLAVSGGAAFVSVAQGSSFLHKTVPYADGGFRLLLPIGKKRLFAGLDVRYVVIFDRDILIMGTVPVLTVSKEF